jgi:hypothetical protein
MSSQNHTFDIAKAIDSAIPDKPAFKGYKTSRSGLPVTIQQGLIPCGASAKGVRVHIDGVVDKADAEQLSEFFAVLSRRLEVYWTE